MATRDEFLAFLRQDSNGRDIEKRSEDALSHQYQQQPTPQDVEQLCSSISTPLSDQLRRPLPPSGKQRNHTRSRSELVSLPLSLSEQLLKAYSKPKLNDPKRKSNTIWEGPSNSSQNEWIHPLKSVPSDVSDDIDLSDVAGSPSHFLAALNDSDAIKSSPPHRRSKTVDHNTISSLNVGGRVMPAEDLLKLTNLQTATKSINYGRFRPLFTPRRVYQNNFVRGKGNALQAAVASIFGLTLLDVPNFVEMSEMYEVSITNFIRESGGTGRCVKILLGWSPSLCNRPTTHTKPICSSEIVLKRSPEEEQRVAAIKENCINMLNSVLDDKRMAIGDLEGFNRRLKELVEGTLLPLKCDCVPDNSFIPKNTIPKECNNKICILRGKSPRGDFKHVVVARHLADGNFEMLHDPYPDGDFLDLTQGYDWCLFFHDD